MQELFTVRDVALMAGLSERTIRSYLREGTLTGRKVGPQWRFTKKDIENLFQDGKVAKRVADSNYEKARAFIKQTPVPNTCLILINEAVADACQQEKQLRDWTAHLSQHKDFWFSFQYFAEQKIAQYILAGATELVAEFFQKKSEGGW